MTQKNVSQVASRVDRYKTQILLWARILEKKWDRYYTNFTWHINHLNEIEKFEYDRAFLEKKNFIITLNSIKRLRKISYYISRGVPVLLEGHSGISKIFDRNFMSYCKDKEALIRFNISSNTIPANLLRKMIGDKNSLAGISSQKCHFLKVFKYGHLLLLDEINLASQTVLQCIKETLDYEVICIEIPGEEKVIKEEQAGKLGEYMIKLNSNNFSEIYQWTLRDINKLFQRQIQQYKFQVYKMVSHFFNLYYFIQWVPLVKKIY